MVVRLPGNLDIETEGKAATLVQDVTADLEFGDATVSTTGAAVLLRDLNDYLTGGMLVLGAIAVGLMVIILLVAFDVRWRLLPLGVVLVGCVWAFGLAGYLDIPLTVVTIAGLPVMLGVGIDYAIQMHARIEEEVALGRSDHPIQESAQSLGPALLVVTFDAIFAFAALRFAKVPMIRDFGLLLAVGVAVICLCSIVGPLAALGIREYRGVRRLERRLDALRDSLGSEPSRRRPGDEPRGRRGRRRCGRTVRRARCDAARRAGSRSAGGEARGPAGVAAAWAAVVDQIETRVGPAPARPPARRSEAPASSRRARSAGWW